MAKTYKRLYEKIYRSNNLLLAWKKARKGKTKRKDVKLFQENIIENLERLQKDLENGTYTPLPLETFILRDPKTRKISKADFRDRIVHHAIINLIGTIFEKRFIYDSCANQIGKGGLFAIKRIYKYIKKVSKNGALVSNSFDNNYVKGFCFKADVRHYFHEVNHEVLMNILKGKIKDERLINLMKKILINGQVDAGKGMPLGNLTSQFLANVYLNKLDYFVKHELRAKYYIRYVDDFVILHSSKEQLRIWKKQIDKFLDEKLKIELHQEKSKIIPLSRGIDFVGFKNFYYHNQLRKRNCKKIISKIKKYEKKQISYEQLIGSFNGWNAYAKWANSYKLRKKVVSHINQIRQSVYIEGG